MNSFLTCCTLFLSLLHRESLALESVNFVPVGCYKDELGNPRPLPELIHNYRKNNQLVWKDLKGSVIEPCAQQARKKNYLYFAIQFYGECWSGPLAHETYSRDGQSMECTQGVGEEKTNMVYRLTGDENECLKYQVFNTKERSVLYQENTGAACDNGMDSKYGEPFVPGWYRFEGEAGTLLNNQSMYHRCLTYGVGWYQGSYPDVTEGIVEGKKVCFSASCHQYMKIRVRNCGGFFVYDLPRIEGCPFRYCGNGIRR